MIDHPPRAVYNNNRLTHRLPPACPDAWQWRDMLRLWVSSLQHVVQVQPGLIGKIFARLLAVAAAMLLES